MLLSTVQTFIESQQLLPEGSKVIVALSGGADSVTLLDILHRLGYVCIGAHVNFHLRDEESDRDAAFSHQFCRDLGIPFYKNDLYAAEYATREGISVEMAARDLRYQWFEELRKEHDAQAIAVAHHRDDSVETLLLNLIRGTGIRGLTGIKPRNGHIVRPLLCCNREQVLAYIQQRQLTFVTDRTNALNDYRRNKIRNEVLPLLESIQPSARASIARTIDHLSETEIMYEDALDKAKKRICQVEKKGTINTLLITLSALEYEKVPQSILYEILSDYGFGRLEVRTIWNNRLRGSGKTYFSHSHRLVFDRDCMMLSARSAVDETEYLLEKDQKQLLEPLSLHCQWLPYQADLNIDAAPSVAYLDVDKLQFPLQIRRPRKGDFFIPFGMRGRKLISDFCIDRKMSAPEKEALWLLCSGEEVVWIIGERIDNRFRIDPKTQQILHICQLNR